MKKISLIAILIIASISTNAQKLQGVKNFLRGFKYEIIAGFGETKLSVPFDKAKFNYDIGVTARNEFKTFYDDKIGLYGITGLIFTSRAGKTDDDFETLLDIDRNVRISVLELPLHVGGEYKFRKCSLFADFGPNILFKLVDNDTRNLKTNGVAIGVGFMLGVRFKRFALGFGYDNDFTNIGKFTPDYQQQTSLGLDKDNYNIKSWAFNILFRWTLGRI